MCSNGILIISFCVLCLSFQQLLHHEAASTQMSHSNNPLPRRVRIVVVCGVLLGLLFFFASLGRHLPHLPSQLHYHLYHHASNVAAAKECSSFAYASVPRWSDFAYVQYVTNPSYLCNSLMILEALRRHGTKADLVMLYPQQWSVPTGNGSDSSYESRLLAHARDLYGTKLSPIHVKTFVNKGDPTWQDSYTKLFAWNQTQYKRVISLDSDATVFDVSMHY
jgi:alpha-N-acetylglucosamine transferase